MAHHLTRSPESQITSCVLSQLCHATKPFKNFSLCVPFALVPPSSPVEVFMFISPYNMPNKSLFLRLISLSIYDFQLFLQGLPHSFFCPSMTLFAFSSENIFLLLLNVSQFVCLLFKFYTYKTV